MLSRFGHVQLFVTPRTVACQAPLSRGFNIYLTIPFSEIVYKSSVHDHLFP